MELYTAQELHDKVFESVYKVYGVFKDFFGEVNVDLQDVPSIGAFEDRYDSLDKNLMTNAKLMMQFKGVYASARPKILVHWDNVTVANEYNESVDIQDLYAMITLTPEGTIPYECLGFLLNRATYDMAQWSSNYMHSHIPKIPKDNPTVFQRPCLGRGPIQNTISELRNTNDEVEWMLFCQELATYVTVESLAGGPYHKLKNIGMGSMIYEGNTYMLPTSNTYCTGLITSFKDICGEAAYGDFVGYYLNNGNLRFNYANNSFSVGMDYFDFMIGISNSFIDFFNERYHDEDMYDRLVDAHVVNLRYVRDNIFYTAAALTSQEDAKNHIGKKVLSFKGKDIKLNINGTSGKEQNDVTLLSNKLAMHILTNILKVINYRYENKYDRQFKAKHTDAETTTAACENVRYL